MMDADRFADKQMELTAEFAKFVFDHPEVDEKIPNGAYVYFHLEGAADFNRYGKRLAQKQARKNGVPIVIVRIKTLQKSRLVEPVIEPFAAPETANPPPTNKRPVKKSRAAHKRSVTKRS